MHFNICLSSFFHLNFQPKFSIYFMFPYAYLCPPLVCLDLILTLCETYKLWSCPLCSFVYHPISSFYIPNILRITLFLDIATFFSLRVRDQVSFPYKTTWEIRVVYFNYIMFWKGAVQKILKSVVMLVF
jgi:hypothetical protein